MKVYLDNEATTKMDERVLQEMMPYFIEEYGNAQSANSLGQTTRKAVEEARSIVASAIGAEPSEIYFTSGGVESNITAIRGLAYSYRRRGNHIITSRAESPVVLETCEQLEKEGFEVTYLDVDMNGFIDLAKLEDSITDRTILITIAYANCETGVIQNIEEIGKIARENGIFFHTDSVQAVGSVKINVKTQRIDSLSLSANKFYGPKGIGALYIRRGLKFKKMMVGGHQERNKRAGTENVPAIVGMGKAIQIAYEEFDKNIPKIIELRNYFVKEVRSKINNISINGDMEKRLPGNANISFYGVDSENLIMNLDMEEIYTSNGNVCISGSLEPSHILLAMQVPYELAVGTLRVSIGKYNTKEEIDFVIEKLVKIVEELRKMEKEEKPACRFASQCGGNCTGCHK